MYKFKYMRWARNLKMPCKVRTFGVHGTSPYGAAQPCRATAVRGGGQVPPCGGQPLPLALLLPLRFVFARYRQRPRWKRHRCGHLQRSSVFDLCLQRRVLLCHSEKPQSVIAGDSKLAMVVIIGSCKKRNKNKEKYPFPRLDRRDAIQFFEFLPFFFLGLR